MNALLGEAASHEAVGLDVLIIGVPTHYRTVSADAARFVVNREGPLFEGEVERAEAWGRRLAAVLRT